MKKSVKQRTVKKKFSQNEDLMLKSLVKQYGTSDWKIIAENMKNRTSRQCRERWKYYLDHSELQKEWKKEEDTLLLQKYEELGPKWSQIALSFSSKNNINVKNRFHKLQRDIRKNNIKKMEATNIKKNVVDNITTYGRQFLTLPVPLSKLNVPGISVC